MSGSRDPAQRAARFTRRPFTRCARCTSGSSSRTGTGGRMNQAEMRFLMVTWNVSGWSRS
eukprot:5810240-Pyramimonas_sp.AAC.1